MRRKWISEHTKYLSLILICSPFAFYLTGCAPSVSSSDQIARFQNAGPIASMSIVENKAEQMQAYVGPYRVISGDILQFQMPAVMRVLSADLGDWLRPVYGRRDVEPYLVRVDQDGFITLPIIDKIHVAGKTLADIEAEVISSYYPRYLVNRPMVVCEVSKYQNQSERIFTVMGLVNKAGAFDYPPDVQYNLMQALAYAGGLDMAADPKYVSIHRKNYDGRIVGANFEIGENAKFDPYSILIKPGDVVNVEHTLHTRLNKLFSDVFRVTVGADARYDY